MRNSTLKIIQAAISSYDLLSYDQGKATVIFMTQQDMRVDDRICMPLSGNEYAVDDPKRPLIPEQTHPNCRCFYIDAKTQEIVTDISSPRVYEERDDGFDPLHITQKKRSWFERITKRIRSLFEL